MIWTNWHLIISIKKCLDTNILNHKFQFNITTHSIWNTSLLLGLYAKTIGNRTPCWTMRQILENLLIFRALRVNDPGQNAGTIHASNPEYLLFLGFYTKVCNIYLWQSVRSSLKLEPALAKKSQLAGLAWLGNQFKIWARLPSSYDLG